MNLNMKNIPCLSYPLPDDVMCLKYAGEYEAERDLIDALLERDLPQPLRERLMMERLFIQGMIENYTIEYQDGLEKLEEEIQDFNVDELKILMIGGHLDWRLNQGNLVFHRYFFSSLLINAPVLRHRLKDKKLRDKWLLQDTMFDDNVEILKNKGKRAFRFHIKHWISPSDDVFVPGQRLRVHLPFPLKNDEQRRIELKDSSPGIVISDGPQRTAYFEAAPKENAPFFIEYTYEYHLQYADLSQTFEASKPARGFEAFVCERLPHIRFTPYLRALLCEILEGKETALEQARAIYDFVTQNVKYAYMRDYFLIENITEFAGSNLRGDCGVQTLLFMTLCRMIGIPTRWQSGFSAKPGSVGSHDWCQFYVHPFGWLYCDLSYGGEAWRSGNMERWNHYFGNLDPFRMVANSEFQTEVNPVKRFMRNDPYDNQTGEIETDHGPLADSQVKRGREMLDASEI